MKKINRRRFLLGGLLSAPFLAVGDAKWLEPGWIKTRRLRLGDGKAGHRLVHITDIHHKGDRAYLEGMVQKINGLAPEFVCFTGDLIEEKQHLEEALEVLAGVKCPIYGVPGNHDYWAKIDFEEIAACFAATGGAWLMDQQAVTRDGRLTIHGAACVQGKQPPVRTDPGRRNLCLMHYPAWVKEFGGNRFDLLLAGHSHGGQVRFPLFGPVFLPWGVEKYDLGLFETPAGPLYVNPGIGWFPVPVRFNCRPEITLIEI